MEWPDHRPRIQHRWPEPRPLQNRRPGIGRQRVGLRRSVAGSAGMDAPLGTAEFDRAAVDRSSFLEINMVPLVDIYRFRRTRMGPPPCAERAVLPAILMEQARPHQAVSLAPIDGIRWANTKCAPGVQARHILPNSVAHRKIQSQHAGRPCVDSDADGLPGRRWPLPHQPAEPWRWQPRR
jgi:hypothetical protein